MGCSRDLSEEEVEQSSIVLLSSRYWVLMSINKYKQCRNTKRGTGQIHEEFLILHDHTWKIFGEDLSPGGTGFKWREVCALELASDSIQTPVWIQQGKSWDFFTAQDVHQWHQCRMSRSVSLEYASIHLSSPVLLLYLSLLLSVISMSVCSEQDWHKVQSYHFLKGFCLELYFSIPSAVASNDCVFPQTGRHC